MSEKKRGHRGLSTARVLAVLGLGLFSTPLQVLACSVCFTDEQSPLTKGAVAGVMTLLAIVGFVLTCIAGTGVYWLQRGRRLGPSETHPGRSGSRGES